MRTLIIIFILLPFMSQSKGVELFAGGGISSPTKYIGSGSYFGNVPMKGNSKGGNVSVLGSVGFYDNLSDNWNIGLVVNATPYKWEQIVKAPVIGGEDVVLGVFTQELASPLVMAQMALNRDISIGVGKLFAGVKGGIVYPVTGFASTITSKIGTSFGVQIGYKHPISKTLTAFIDNSINSVTLSYSGVKSTNFLMQSAVGVRVSLSK